MLTNEMIERHGKEEIYIQRTRETKGEEKREIESHTEEEKGFKRDRERERERYSTIQKLVLLTIVLRHIAVHLQLTRSYNLITSCRKRL